MQNVDTIINAKWVIPVEPAGFCLNEHSVVIDNGRIVAILPQADCAQQYHSDTIVELKTHALIPGFVNAHTHAAMSLFRGMADDLPLMQWLQEHIWPAEGTWVNADFVECGSELAIAEMIRGGITCMNDMYFFPDITADVANRMGMRAGISLIVLGFPTVWAKDADEYIHKGLEIHDRFRHHPLISTCFGPHAPYTVDDQSIRRIVTYAEELDIPIQMHVHETSTEVQDARQNSGMSPIQRLHKLDIISPRLMAVHMTSVDDEDMAVIADSGAHVVHCPQSNLKLASGLCQVQNWMELGVNVCLGTDGAASNNDLDMMGEMQCAALLAKVVDKNATALTAAQALRMATLNGAKAMGLDKHIGSLVVGKAADITAIDLNHLATTPVYDPISQIVYAAGRDQVSDVWVAGKQLLKQRQFTQYDQNAIIAEAQAWADKISEKTNPSN